MSDVSPIGNAPISRVDEYTSNASIEQNEATGIERKADSIDLSSQARRLADLVASSPVRQELVNRIRAEIEAGTYESEAKINVAIDRLAEDL